MALNIHGPLHQSMQFYVNGTILFPILHIHSYSTASRAVSPAWLCFNQFGVTTQL